MSRTGAGRTAAMRRVAIVIVSFNTRVRLEACLASLRAAPPATGHEIVVIDNGSRDGSPDAVEAGWPEARLVRLATNTGFAPRRWMTPAVAKNVNAEVMISSPGRTSFAISANSRASVPEETATACPAPE